MQRNVCNDVRLLALIDFIVIMTETPGVPREALDAFPLIVDDILVDAVDMKAESLPADVVEGFTQAAKELRLNSPLPVANAIQSLTECVLPKFESEQILNEVEYSAG
jgi:hypothetical protein